MIKQGANKSQKRPAIISILCIIFFISFSLSIIGVFPEMIDRIYVNYGAWSVSLWIGQALRTFVSMVGYWQMRKWGVYLYTAIFVVGTITGFLGRSPFTILGVVMPLIIIIIGFYYLKRMH